MSALGGKPAAGGASTSATAVIVGIIILIIALGIMWYSVPPRNSRPW